MRSALKVNRLLVLAGIIAIGACANGGPDDGYNTPGVDPPGIGETPEGQITTGQTPDVKLPSGRLIFATQKLDADAVDGGAAFSIKALRELHVHTLWSDLSGEHRELRRIYAPDGSLYHQKLVPFSTTLTAPKPFVTKTTLPHARVIQPALLTKGGEVAVWDYLGVAGTWISEHGMTGTWRIEVTLDNQTKPSMVATFELTP